MLIGLPVGTGQHEIFSIGSRELFDPKDRNFVGLFLVPDYPILAARTKALLFF